MAVFVTCWRCGVDYDPTPFIAGAPCEDCQLDVPGDWVAGGTSGYLAEEIAEIDREIARLKEVRKELEENRIKFVDSEITRMNKVGQLDSEIAKILGYKPATIAMRRRKLDLKAPYRPEKHLWKDTEAQKAHAIRMVEKRVGSTRGKKVELPQKNGWISNGLHRVKE